MNDLTQTLTNVNMVLSGQKTIEVKARIPHIDMALFGGVVFLSVFAAITLANLTKN